MKRHNWKKETIQACNELVGLYSRIRMKHRYFVSNTCPLCTLYKNNHTDIYYCNGCPLSFLNLETKEIGPYCFHMNSYDKASYSYHEFKVNNNMINKTIEDKIIVEKLKQILQYRFSIRKAFFKDLVKILETIPANQFGPKKWQPLFYTGFKKAIDNNTSIGKLITKYVI